MCNDYIDITIKDNHIFIENISNYLITGIEGVIVDNKKVIEINLKLHLKPGDIYEYPKQINHQAKLMLESIIFDSMLIIK